MITRPYLRLLLLGQICSLLLLASWNLADAAIGIYNFSAQAAGSAMPITIDYRLNSPGLVTIEIRSATDAVVATLGPYDETIGLHSHTWDNGGASLPSGNYRARIYATNDGGSPDLQGTLVPMFEEKAMTQSIYGLTIDRFPESPAYGTIYVSDAYWLGGRLLAYYADGTPKNWVSGDATGNALLLHLGNLPAKAPWGIGVDRHGNVYVSCISTGSSAGVSVFDHQGNKLPYVLQTDPTGIVWLDGLATSGGLEVYETKGATVRYSVLSGDTWTIAMDPGLSGTSIETKGICFETSGTACYVATLGTSSSPENPGVTRFIRQLNGSWTKDAGFQCGLSQIPFGSSYMAARYATGVSCDSRDPDGDGPYAASTVWVGLGTNNYYGGNLARVSLPSGTTTLFAGPGGQARFVAADSVGNVAYEHSKPGGQYSDLWSRWIMKAPGGEPSQDARLTNWVSIAGTANRKVLSSITDVKREAPDTLVELSSGRRVSATFDGYFYIEEEDRSAGIKVECATPVAEGASVRVGGRVSGIDEGERYLAEAEILSP